MPSFLLPSFPSFTASFLTAMKFYHGASISRVAPSPSLPRSLAQVAQSLALPRPRLPSRSQPVTQAHISFEAPFHPSLSEGRKRKGTNQPTSDGRTDPTATLELLNDDDNSMSGRAREENVPRTLLRLEEGGRTRRELIHLLHEFLRSKREK